MARRKDQPQGDPVGKSYPAPSVPVVIPTTEIGVSGFRVSAGLIFEERLTRLSSERMRELYRQMVDTDPVIGAVMLAIEQTMRSVEWRVDPENGTDDAKRDADFLWSCMNDMSHTWQDFVSDVLSMLTYGWSAFEIVYKYRLGGPEEGDPTIRSSYNDAMLGWRKFGFRSQLTLWRWAIEPDGGLKGMYQLDPNNPGKGAVFIPIQKLLLFRTKQAGGSPEGRSILRPAVRPWYFKKYIEELEGIGLERNLVGIPKLKVPENVDIFSPKNSELLSRLKHEMEQLSRDRKSAVVLPPGFDIELISGGSGQADTGSIISRYDQRIAMSVLAQFIILGSERVGSYALASQHKDLFTISLEGWLSSIEQVINRYAVRRLMYLNRRPTTPSVSHYPILQPTLTELSAFLRDTVNVNLITPDFDLEDWLRRRAQLPPRREDGSQEQVTQEAVERVRTEVLERFDNSSATNPEDILKDILPRDRTLRLLEEATGDADVALSVYSVLEQQVRGALSARGRRIQRSRLANGPMG